MIQSLSQGVVPGRWGRGLIRRNRSFLRPSRKTNGTQAAGLVVICGVGMLLAPLDVDAAEVAGTASRAQRRKTAVAVVPVGSELRRLIEADWIARDARFSSEQRAKKARNQKPRRGDRTNQAGVTTAEDASGGCDGIKNGRWGFHTASGEQDPWWQVDLGRAVRLDRIVVFNRTDRNTAPRTRHLRILVSQRPGREGPFVEVYRHNGRTFYGVQEGKPLVVDLKEKDVVARVVRLMVPGRCSFALDEVEVYGADAPDKNIALGRPADQKSVGPYSYPGTLPEGMDRAARKAGQPTFSFEHTRLVISRARELAKRIRCRSNAERLNRLADELERIAARLQQLEMKIASVPLADRRQLYLDARWVARRIAFCNPLLAFDKLLFVKRHDAGGVFHMVDQYYGCNAKPGGGLFVLHDPFGPEPRLENLLADSVVERGRLKGRRLEPGSFLSPELSFDGRTIYFAYTEAKAWPKYRGKTAYEWNPECCYHIFKCNVNGDGLVQLTDGPWDEFDPCELPNGRIVFISMRRGGYLRCGRHCPTYTMFSMEPDGSDIVCLSFHETHEWHPSVTNDGMIVYTRWDYVDRDTNVAHHIWLCYPDGRDPQTFHGNYPTRREDRPWMEMSIRAVPNSHKFVAVAAAHHGHAFGSLVLIDPHSVDDGAMAQLTRLTPEIPFPEAEGGRGNIRRFMVYATPWPLSEDDYLCAYDPEARNHGLYWIDRFGNKELIYRDPAIACLDPIPLRPRPRPPVIPDQTTQTARARKAAGGDRLATIAVLNVYDSDFEWPEGTRVTELRIIQVLPKTTPPPNQPRIGVAAQTNARAVLGTVPVEPDGSVYFEAPVGKEIYFQALDERGMAVQSMRSGTYVHPGEQLTCAGCHAPKRTPTLTPDRLPLALRRPPSRIRPEVEGSNPFNFVRLVQPVLDRHCVACHEQRKAVDLTATIDGPHGWTRSYRSLAGKYGFYFNVRNGSINDGVHGGVRTIPGQFGARASKLLEYLDERHYGVRLPPEDLRRITLWLDCNSEFYGSYENTAAQARGEVVLPTLD